MRDDGFSLQFCDTEANQDITGSPTAGRDATEVRMWCKDGTNVATVTRAPDGTWRASASDECDWTYYAETPHTSWRDALQAMLADLGYEMPEE